MAKGTGVTKKCGGQCDRVSYALIVTHTRTVNLRLTNQRLLGSEFDKPAELIKFLGAVQAQDFYGAKWALGLRLRNATDAQIEQAFADGDIVRTHVMRQTWHFVAPSDIRWLLKLTAPRVNTAMRSYYRKFELDDAVFKRTSKAFERALRRGKNLTRQELRAAISKAGVLCDDPLRFNFILVRAELDALICSGPRRGKQFTYALVDERVPETKALSREESLAELTRRYFTSHGPATLKDFIWWSGLSVTEARTGLDSVRGELLKETSDGVDYWLSAAPSKPTLVRNAVHLLPSFDEYFVAYKDRRAAIDSVSNQQSVQSSAVLKAPVVVNGVFVGHWKPTVVRSNLTISFDLVSSLNSRDNRALAGAIDRYRDFVLKC